MHEWNYTENECKTLFIIKDKNKLYTIASDDNSAVTAFRNCRGYYEHWHRRWVFYNNKLEQLKRELELAGFAHIEVDFMQVPTAFIKFHFEKSPAFTSQVLFFTAKLPLPAALLNEFNKKYTMTRSNKNIKFKGNLFKEFLEACTRHQILIKM